jgi:dTDP-4-amino-4,6-dideoxygalactose transaminase
MNFIIKFFFILKNANLFLYLKLIKVLVIRDFSKYPSYLFKFQELLKSYFKIKYCLTFSSGSAAFYAALKSFNFGPSPSVLISRMTFPSVYAILKKEGYKIFIYEVDDNFQPIISKNLSKIKFELLIVTHPYGFFVDWRYLKKKLNNKIKIIFDLSHAHGGKFKKKQLSNFADISFLSIQGSKAISGGEGGIILTNNIKYYKNMINSHHPGYSNNYSKNIAGLCKDIKLRMHPLAALIASEDIYKLDKRNYKNINKFNQIYKYLSNYPSIFQIPDYKKFLIGGFHFGLPFFSEKKIFKNYPFLKYNWLIKYDFERVKIVTRLNKLYFIDLNFIKLNPFYIIKQKINEIL